MSSNYDMEEEFAEELNETLMFLINKGLVECGPDENGEIVFWATQKGMDVAIEQGYTNEDTE
jgi:hypothetical protein